LIKYHKAIRDKIPQIISQSGNSCSIKKLSNAKFLVELEKKLGEELAEYQKSKNPEELADIIEVIIAIARLRGTSQKKLERIRLKKLKSRGGFAKNLFLISTSDNSR